MTSHAKLIRVIGLEFLRRRLRSITLSMIAVSAILVGLGIWLISLSGWWWILMAIIIGWILLAILLLSVSWFAVKLLQPEVTKVQKQAVSEYVDKIERVSESIQTPPFIIFIRILKDVLFPSGEPYIKRIAKDGSSLHADYIQLHNNF